MNVKFNLGKRIRFLRKERKMTIEDLALEANVNRNYLCDLENGKRNVSIEILSRIAQALQISLAELFRGVE